MQIVEKIMKKQRDFLSTSGVTIAFLGDSVTQGCFDVYWKPAGSVQTVFNQENGYHRKLAKLLAMLYPAVPFNMINAGISGTTAPMGLERLERDVLAYHPDLVVVCFGLNDAMSGPEHIGAYTDALGEIFTQLRKREIEVIFMTPNMMCTRVSDHLSHPKIIEIAESAMQIQNSGVLRMYLDEAKKICQDNGIPVCDCYQMWELMYQNGVQVTELLSNKINHPTVEMNWLFAVSLLKTIMN